MPSTASLAVAGKEKSVSCCSTTFHDPSIKWRVPRHPPVAGVRYDGAQ